MKDSLPDLGKAEWRLMEALWARGRATASELQRELEPREHWAYSTVKTMLDRLVEKSYAKSRRVGSVHEYSPRVRRGSAVANLVDDLVEAGREEVRERDLDDRPQPRHRHPDRGADEAELAGRRVDHAVRAELPEQAPRLGEDPARTTDVLPHQERVRVAGELA